MNILNFRAWFEDPISKKWQMSEVDAIFRNRDASLVEILIKSETELFEKPINFKLMQYTGLNDKNGKEIYEGDIVLTDLSRPYLIVEFRNGAFMYRCHDSGSDYYDIMIPIERKTDVDKHGEIVGNIYENPELLIDVQEQAGIGCKEGEGRAE